MSIQHQMINTALKDIAKQQESIILAQLNDFVSRGLILIEQGPMQIVQDEYSDKLVLKSSVRLILKDKEYIEKLEKINIDLKDLIQRMQDAAKSISEVR